MAAQERWEEEQKRKDKREQEKSLEKAENGTCCTPHAT